MTKLCCFNQISLHFPALKHYAELCQTVCKRTVCKWTVLGSVRRKNGLQTLQISTLLTAAPWWKSMINSSQSLRWLMSLSGKDLPHKHMNKAVANFIKYMTVTVAADGGHWLRTWLWMPMVVTDCPRGCGCQWWWSLTAHMAVAASGGHFKHLR